MPVDYDLDPFVFNLVGRIPKNEETGADRWKNPRIQTYTSQEASEIKDRIMRDLNKTPAEARDKEWQDKFDFIKASIQIFERPELQIAYIKGKDVGRTTRKGWDAVLNITQDESDHPLSLCTLSPTNNLTGGDANNEVEPSYTPRDPDPHESTSIENDSEIARLSERVSILQQFVITLNGSYENDVLKMSLDVLKRILSTETANSTSYKTEAEMTAKKLQSLQSEMEQLKSQLSDQEIKNSSLTKEMETMTIALQHEKDMLASLTILCIKFEKARDDTDRRYAESLHAMVHSEANEIRVGLLEKQVEALELQVRDLKSTVQTQKNDIVQKDRLIASLLKKKTINEGNDNDSVTDRGQPTQVETSGVRV